MGSHAHPTEVGRAGRGLLLRAAHSFPIIMTNETGTYYVELLRIIDGSTRIPGMNSLHHILRRAQRRTLVSRSLHHCGWGLAAGCGVAVTVLMLDRLAGAAVPIFAYWIVLALGTVAGVIVAIITQPDRQKLAVHLDRALRLKDRMGTATGLAATPFGDPAFAALVQHDAEQLAARLDVRSATLIHLTRIWTLTIPLTILTALAALYLPEADWSQQNRAVAMTPQQQQQVDQQREQVVSAINESVAALPRNEPLNPRAQEQLDALDKLSQQLTQSDTTPEQVKQARDESAARMTELADQLAQQSQRDLIAADEVTRRFAGLDQIDAPTAPLSAHEFTEALRRGDFGKAAQQLEHLLKNDSLTTQDRRDVAEHLRNLASHIDDDEPTDATPHEPSNDEPGAESSPDAADTQREALEQMLHDRGLEQPEIDALLNDLPEANELAQRLQEHGLEEDRAQQLARDMERIREQQQIEQQTQDQIEQVKEALQQAADELEQPASQQPPTVPPSSSEPRQPENVNPSPSPSTEPSTPAEQSPSAASPNEHSPQAEKPTPAQPSPAPKEQPQPQTQPPAPNQPPPQGQPPSPSQGTPPSPTQSPPQTPQQSPPSTQQQQQQSPSQQQQSQPSPSQSSPQRDPSQPSSDQSQPTPTPNPDGQPTQRDGSTPAPSQQDQSQQNREPVPQQTPNQPQQQQSQQAERQAEPGTTPSPQPPATPSELLRRLADRSNAAREQRQTSERLRQAARELAQRMTPQEREQWAQQWQREQGQSNDPDRNPLSHGESNRTDGPSSPPQSTAQHPLTNYEADTKDIGGTDPGERTLAQWLSEAPPGEPLPSNTPSGATQRIRQAQQVAERAVDESIVQKRYHRLIQRYFGGLPQTVDKAVTPPAKP